MHLLHHNNCTRCTYRVSRSRTNNVLIWPKLFLEVLTVKIYLCNNTMSNFYNLKTGSSHLGRKGGFVAPFFTRFTCEKKPLQLDFSSSNPR